MIQNKGISKATTYLLFLAAAAFVLFYLILSYYNRPTCDDFGNIFYAKDRPGSACNEILTCAGNPCMLK